MGEKMSVLYDASKCTACRACTVACKQWNNLPAEKTTFTRSYQTHQEFTPQTRTFISFREVWENNKIEWFFCKEQCMHCSDAACLKSCNQNAIFHNEQGFVVIDHDKCIGCGYCVANCVFNVPRLDAATNKSHKCNGCFDRVANSLTPSCVQICQPEALIYGKRDEIMSLAAKRFAQVKSVHPQAVLYDAAKLNGINFTYILLRSPDFYGLPSDPVVPMSVSIWKDVLRPVAPLAVAGALLATLIGFIKTRGQSDPYAPSERKDKGVDKHG